MTLSELTFCVPTIIHPCGILLLTQAHPKMPCIYTSIANLTLEGDHSLKLGAQLTSKTGPSGWGDLKLGGPILL